MAREGPDADEETVRLDTDEWRLNARHLFQAPPKYGSQMMQKKAALNSAYSENGEAANSRMWTLKLDFPVISGESWLGSLGSESPIRSFSFLLEVA